MSNKQLYLLVVTGLLLIGGLSPSARTLAAPPSEHEGAPLTRYLNIIADHLGQSLITRGRLAMSTIYVDKKHTALDVTQYLEKQLSTSLKKADVRLAPVATARYTIELDVEINERSDGNGTAYSEGGDIDQLWMIQALQPRYFGQRTHYEMIPLAMNQPVKSNPLSGINTEMIITARIMERGRIRTSQNYAFYFTAEDLMGENGQKHGDGLKSEEEFNDGVFTEFYYYHHRRFLDYQEKLDGDVEQLINSYQL